MELKGGVIWEGGGDLVIMSICANLQNMVRQFRNSRIIHHYNGHRTMHC